EPPTAPGPPRRGPGRAAPTRTAKAKVAQPRAFSSRAPHRVLEVGARNGEANALVRREALQWLTLPQRERDELDAVPHGETQRAKWNAELEDRADLAIGRRERS